MRYSPNHLICSLIFIAVQAACGTLQAQVSDVPDSVRVSKVMLIPYDHRYYLSDADRDIMDQSKMEPVKFRNDFRHNIDRHVQRSISGSYYCISLLNDTADALEETMHKVLSRTGYKYEKAIPITPKSDGDEKAGAKLKKTDASQHNDFNTATQYIPDEKDAVYMRAIVNKPNELFDELNKTYDADYFVFLTQLDIKTNYNSCLDIANKIYRREVKLHFTIYDKQANLIAGTYATTFFPSNSNHANKIIGDCFPELGKFVASCLP